MILSAWSPLITTLGMVRWEVCSKAASAAVDRPGVLAIASNVGASDCSSVRQLIHEMAFRACLARDPEALLCTTHLRGLRAARHRPYHRRDDEADH